MEERRRIDRVAYGADSVIVVCEDLQKIYGRVKNLSPLGMAVTVKADTPSILGKDIIIVADTLIMYADVVREDEGDDGTRTVALSARKFTGDVLQYLFEHIALDEEEK
ncbi:MAG: hypothetical protein K5796_05950 [Lachnospiraceae bacterium]|nr:hypothetical protein [Lachnospiraceae bacterium]